ncbi:hypothetical protein [Rufibacter psychrotolerans]|uniref:hypothetical protein n=1 Tax=Rufibacter psychrotolerans TaxID=2812556 RepID=UPI0019679AB1|nr:hypothetical protein [Rufibacter sp. SYSU D00308]
MLVITPTTAKQLTEKQLTAKRLNGKKRFKKVEISRAKEANVHFGVPDAILTIGVSVVMSTVDGIGDVVVIGAIVGIGAVVGVITNNRLMPPSPKAP